MNEHQDREQEIFAQALELSPKERAEYLDSACAGDSALRNQVESLIDAMEQAGEQGFFDQPTGGASEETVQIEDSGSLHAEEKPGAIIGNYTVQELIGEGGFGSVYRAQQTSPVNREVALKIIKLGMDTRQVISRFEAERQALAMMDHSGIAKVYDAGATNSGRPYFVMELVHGVAITHYCDQHTLSIRDRLNLFRKVCDAVQHAHQKSIIHRDIKPSNVLVCMQDGQPSPKVIDFGVAKATTMRLSEHTVHTQARQLVGTPAYMSPEQAGMSQEDIDTRSDVYSLGVLLYELLTGATPLEGKTLSKSSYEVIQRMIRDVTPPKPSTRLSSIETTTEIAQFRHTEPKKLQQEIQGDLDWIVMKALEKDRTRRYEGVNALAEDIGRYLEKEPIHARPPTNAYKLSMFVQRNRKAVAAALALFGVLLLGIAGTTSGLVWALDEREKARLAAADELAAQIEATKASEQAASEAQRATLEAQTAEELSRFFVMDVLSAADPARTTNKELTVREALVNASDSIEGRFEGRPDFESKIHNALGYLFGRLGSLERAEHHHRREWALTQQEHGELSFENARIMHSVVGDLAMQERDAEAIELTQRQLAIIDQLDSPEASQFRLRVIGNLGALLIRTERIEEAAPILQETLQIKREQYGDRHPTTLSTIDALATLMGRTGNFDRALELANEAYAGQAEVLGEGDPRTLNTLVKLSLAHTRLGQHTEALALLKAGIEQTLQRLGPTHPTSIYLRSSYARSLFDVGEYDRAEEIALALITDLESRDPEMLQENSRATLTTLTSCLVKKEQYEPALDVVDRALRSARTAYGEQDTRLAEYLNLRAKILQDLNRFEDAEADLIESWACVNREDAIDDQQEPTLRSLTSFYEKWHEIEPASRYLEKSRIWKARLDALGSN